MDDRIGSESHADARPRDWAEACSRLLRECKRFAETAIYEKPVGRGRISGPSILFVETAVRCMTKVLPEASSINDDADKRIIRVSVIDLEVIVTYSKDVLIPKIVERKSLKDGREPLSDFTDSYGKTT